MYSILIEILGYKLSWIEACAVCASFVCIMLAVKEKLATFPFGLLATALYFLVFYRLHLYSSMLLQIVFFAFNFYGLYKWTQPDKDSHSSLKVSTCTAKQRWYTVLFICVGGLLWGFVSSHIHLWWTEAFTEAAQYAYLDSFVLVASLIAQYLLAIKKIENWVLWFVINIVATVLYVVMEAWFTAVLYFVLIFMAFAGWKEWYKSMCDQKE